MGQSKCDCRDCNCNRENNKQKHRQEQRMLQAATHNRWMSAVLILTAMQGIFCLQCEVGINNETSAMECEGSWEKMQEMMKEKLGGKWEEMKNNLTGDMTDLIEQFKKQFEELKNSLENALTPKTGEERRKRQAEEVDEMSPFHQVWKAEQLRMNTELLSESRMKRAEEGAAEPEPESEPEGEEYYCIKSTMGENTVKSCLPKSIADPLKMACGLIPTEGTVCVCNGEDLCNSGPRMAGSWEILGMLLVAGFCFRM